MANYVTINRLGIIEQHYDGPQTGQTMKQFTVVLRKKVDECRSQGQRVNLLVDVSKLGPSSGAARKHGITMMRRLKYHKLAIVGTSPFNKSLANFMIYTSGKRRRYRFFSSRNTAIDWLTR